MFVSKRKEEGRGGRQSVGARVKVRAKASMRARARKSEGLRGNERARACSCARARARERARDSKWERTRWWEVKGVWVCVYVCVYMWVYACACARRVCVSVCLCVCACVCMYNMMHVSTQLVTRVCVCERERESVYAGRGGWGVRESVCVHAQHNKFLKTYVVYWQQTWKKKLWHFSHPTRGSRKLENYSFCITMHFRTDCFTLEKFPPPPPKRQII